MEEPAHDDLVSQASGLLAAGADADPVAWSALASRAGRAPAAVRSALDDLLGQPSRRLVAYGTLRPGEPNHHLLEGLGAWEHAAVRGRLGDWAGYPILRPDRSAGAVPVMVLTAGDLPRRIGELDTFEGPAYRRSWVVATRGDGAVLVAQCYIDARCPAS